MKLHKRSFFIALGLGAVLHPAEAQRWQLDILPHRLSGNVVSRIVGDTQVGFEPYANGHALIWHGPGGEVTDLNPPGYDSSKIIGGTGSYQVGSATLMGTERAAIWQGTAASYRELTTPGASSAVARDLDGDSVYGYAVIGGVFTACKWDFGTGTFTSLNPPGATASLIYTSKQGRQYGSATLNGVRRGYVWQNGAPVGSLDDLYLQGTNAAGTDGQAGVGTMTIPDSSFHAVFWSSPGGQIIDLNTPGSNGSQAFAVEASKIVGFLAITFYDATIWHMDTQTVEDLQQYVPGNGGSTARDIDVLSNGELIVVGNKINTGGISGEPLYWHFFPAVTSEVESFSVLRGAQVGGNLMSLRSKDSDALVLRNGPVVGVTDSPVSVQFEGDTLISDPKRFRLKMILKASTAGLQGTIDLFDWTTGTWDLVETKTADVGLNYATIEVDTQSNLGRFIRGNDGALRARLRVKQAGPVTSPTWFVFVDQAIWQLTR